jgi:hypothetical protein
VAKTASSDFSMGEALAKIHLPPGGPCSSLAHTTSMVKKISLHIRH